VGGFSDSVRKFFKPDPNAVGEWGYTRLQRAISVNDVNKVYAAITAGADLNLRGNYKYPPLHMALRADNYTIVLALLKAGADVNGKDIDGRTPLHIAAEMNQESLALALLRFNADPSAQDNLGRTPAHLLVPHGTRLAEALAKHEAKLNTQDKDGNTPLHRFVEHPEMVSRLFTDGADVNVANAKGLTPFMLMLDGDKRFQRYPVALQKAIVAKADLHSTNPLGETILHLAARLDLEGSFLTAVEKAELTAKDANGNSVLHAVACTQNTRMILRLLQLAPELVSETNKAGLTPMEELLRHVQFSGEPAAQARWLEPARALLTANADPDSTDAAGRSVLHMAVVFNKTDFLDEALVGGASPNLEDGNGKTALHFAIERKNLKAMDILLDRGANPDMTDKNGWTILDRLAEGGDRESSFVQRLIVAGGQYQKQLPLYPELMRRPKILGKPNPGNKPSAGPKL
jgi:ankyrin repeat protein